MNRVHAFTKIAVLALVALMLMTPRAAMAKEGEQYRLSPVAVNTGLDNGYSQDNPIKGDDFHFGWELGYFYVTGQTQVAKDADSNPLVLKNTGDDVRLWFHLAQDIDHLNGIENLSIAQDINGYDERMVVEKSDFGRGALIVKHTDSHNMGKDAGPYVDYLTGKSLETADTEVELCEEGDYEVALDYEVVEDNPIVFPLGYTLPFDTPFQKHYENYRIHFTFSVRNADCMVYPRDVKTNGELTTSSYTENGFYLDLAKSRYLEVNLKREVLSEGVDGTVLETKLNTRVSADDENKFTDEGIYTITAHNPETGLDTTKVIYVGTDSILKACAEQGKTVDEVLEQQKQERELEDAVYAELVKSLADKGLYVSDVQVSYLSQEYLANLEYNSRENIYFGYKLSDITQAMDGAKYVFTVGDDGKTAVKEFEAYDDTVDRIVRNVATGTGVIVVTATVAVVAPAVGAPAAVTAVFVMATKGAVFGSISGAAIGGTLAGVVEYVDSGDLEQASKAALLQASEDYKWGAIVGAISGGSEKLLELRSLSKGGLTLSEAAKLQKLGLPNSIIKNLHSMDEFGIYDDAGLIAERLASGEWAYLREIDLTTEIDGMTNAERILKGKSPLDPTGKPYELHHVGQNPDSPLAILTKSEHMQGGNNKILHWRDSSEVEHGANWQKQVSRFWKAYLEMHGMGA